jgi:mono/diheme cytochrome c family protein
MSRIAPLAAPIRHGAPRGTSLAAAVQEADMFARIATATVIAAGTIALAAAQGAPGVPGMPAAREQPDGASLYRAHCASCHGVSGRGDGPVARFLKHPPANLTRIGARNAGVFPADRVARAIDGRNVARTHGDSTMPVWGPIFARSPIVADEAAVEARIRALLAYLESMQERPGE